MAVQRIGIVCGIQWCKYIDTYVMSKRWFYYPIYGVDILKILKIFVLHMHKYKCNQMDSIATIAHMLNGQQI